MKYTQLTVLISLALQQVNFIQAYVIDYSNSNSLDPRSLEEDEDQAPVLQKRLDSVTGAIVPYKGAGAIVPHQSAGGGHTSGPAPRKGMGRNAKIVAGVGGAIAVAGAVGGAIGLTKHIKNKKNNKKMDKFN